jgi:malate dehydrogenase (oxaloacetate-decarboxylating)
VLVGVTGVQGLFTEEVVRAAAAGVPRPVVLPLSNPTVRAEAVPEDVLAWTDGRALVGTGSPFSPVVRDGVVHEIAQVNNAYVFPGVGLGVVAVGATAVSDAMMTAAADAVGSMTPATGRAGTPLLPPLTLARAVARRVAEAVAWCAVEEGLTSGTGGPHTQAEVAAAITATVWEPSYDSA